MEQFVSKKYSLKGFVTSSIGGRKENQDSYGFMETPLGALAIVCDGMGGGPAGSVASFKVCEEIMRTLGSAHPGVVRETALREAVVRAQQTLESMEEQNMQYCGMGTTLTAVLVNEESALLAWAGDSRIYQLRGSKMVYRTADHSLVAELVRRKAMTEEQARRSPQANVITRGLGHLGNNIPDVVEVPYKAGDRFVLCTDGVWGSMTHNDIVSRFTSDEDLCCIVAGIDKEVDKIGAAAGGHHDNHTLAIMEMGKDSLKHASAFPFSMRSAFKALSGVFGDVADGLSSMFRWRMAGTVAVMAVALLCLVLTVRNCAKPTTKGVVASSGGGGSAVMSKPSASDPVEVSVKKEPAPRAKKDVRRDSLSKAEEYLEQMALPIPNMDKAKAQKVKEEYYIRLENAVLPIGAIAKFVRENKDKMMEMEQDSLKRFVPTGGAQIAIKKVRFLINGF